MLRLTALLLLLANGLFFAWSQGLLGPWGFAPVEQSEPQRMSQQIRPDSLRILGPEETRRVETAVATSAPRSAECLQVGPFEDAQLTALRRPLEAWPVGSWSFEATVEPARWIVYMGRYAGADSINKKKAELRQLGVSFESLANPSLEPGLSLGGFTNQAEATRQLEELSRRGVRTAHVVEERPEVRGQFLRLPAVDESLRPRLEELKTLLGGKSMRPCR